VSLTPKGGTDGTGKLVLQGTVKTYRYLDDDETADAKAKGASGKGNKRGRK
jgi:type IV pilus assembly protein PilO